jgi:hypothetical protein
MTFVTIPGNSDVSFCPSRKFLESLSTLAQIDLPWSIIKVALN